MTSELEQEFYKTFEIEPISKWHKCKDYNCVCCDEYDNCTKREFIYPEITAEKMLEMICLINKNTKYYNNSTYFKQDYKNLKDEILEETLFCYKINCLFNKEKEQFKQQIQQLFKEDL